jgi:SAM-dependent methyltransferase
MRKQPDRWNPDLAGDYDRIADSYTDAYGDELDRKQFDRDVLDRFAVNIAGLVCDLGCGPGHVSRYLHSRGVQVIGLDLSPRMIAIACRRNPGLRYEIGDMRKLRAPACSFGGILSFYALIHIRRDEVVSVLREMWRVLNPAGRLLLACHSGRGDVHAEERFGHPVSLDATLFEPDELAGYVADAGFVVDETLVRKPYDFEYQAEKIYLLATKPASHA